MTQTKYEIGTEWKSGQTNEDGTIRRFETFREALAALPDVVDMYKDEPECRAVFIDKWQPGENYDAVKSIDPDGWMYEPVCDILRINFETLEIRSC